MKDRTGLRRFIPHPSSLILKLLLARSRRGLRGGLAFGLLGLARLGQAEHVVLDAGLLEERGDGLAGDGALVQPIATAIEIDDELAGLVLGDGVVEAQLLENGAIARIAGIDGVHAVKREVLTTHSLQANLDSHGGKSLG